MNTDIKKHYALTLTFTELLLGHKKDTKHSPHSYFYRDNKGRPLLLDRHIIGFLKEAAQALNEVYGDELENILVQKVFVAPKEMLLVIPNGDIFIKDRPPHLFKVDGRKVRSVEVTSEAAPVGATVECELLVYPGVGVEVLEALLDYGALKGIGLGRNQGFGRFEYELKEGGEDNAS